MESGRALGARLACRDESALEDAYRTYGPSLLAYLRRYVGPDDAEDVLQHTFLDAWRSADRYDPRQGFSSWLFTIAHHRAVDTLRKGRHVVVDVEAARGLVGEDGREVAERYADAAEVHAALDRLPDHEREVLELAYFSDLTQRAIAARLDVPLGTVKARAARGTKRLAALLSDDPRGIAMTHPDLFALLRGELTNREATEAGSHLELCSRCRDEVAELAVGNALITRAVRTTGAGGAAATPLPAVPPLRRPRRHQRPVLLVAAAAVVVGAIGGAVTTAAVTSPDDQQPPAPPAAYASAELAPVTGSAVGEVQMVAEDREHTQMTIQTHDLPAPGRHQFYYAWLLDPATNKMLPLGQVGPTGTATFELDDSLLDAYAAVDVSLEDDDGDPGHSVTSVLRGTYGERTTRS